MCSTTKAAACSTELPSITVIIPAFNCGILLIDAVESVESQAYSSVDIVIVDDGSTDNTGKVANDLRGRAMTLSQRNAGPSCARNLGLSNATGDYVLFLDADDILPPGYLHSLAGAATALNADFVCCGWREITPGGRLLVEFAAPTINECLFNNLIPSNAVAIHCVLLRRKLVNKIGGFDESLRQHEDWDLWLRIAANLPSVAVVPSVFAVYRRVAGSNSSSSENMIFTSLRVRQRAVTLCQSTEQRALARQYFKQAIRIYVSEVLKSLWQAEGFSKRLQFLRRVIMHTYHVPELVLVAPWIIIRTVITVMLNARS